MKVIYPILPKIGGHGNNPWGIGKKLVRIDNTDTQSFHLVKKIVKIGPVDPEIALLNLKKKEIMEGKIYSPVGNLAERAKLKKLGHWKSPEYRTAALLCCVC